MGAIKTLIQEAVSEAVTHLSANVTDSERKRVAAALLKLLERPEIADCRP